MKSARVVRQKKLSKSSGQQVLREDELDNEDFNSLQATIQFESGVEKSEEKEFHLQAALAASGCGAGERDGEIPAPPAEETTDIDYDTLYSLAFDKTATYIRFSQTVEECTGCQYDMTTEDDGFLTVYNQKKSAAAKCSEDDFEKIMEIFEETAELQTPFASVDSTVVPFETMRVAVKQELKNEPGYTRDIYEYWKNRRQDSGNNVLQPSLKFETHQDNDDGDPYVCFRRREVRQTRKTRARDVQSTDRLRKLRQELEEGRKLVNLAQHRETIKRSLLRVDRSIFEQRCKVKDAKVRLGIKTDDEDLLTQRQPKRKISDHPQIRIQPGGPLRLPGRSDGRAFDADLILLSDINEEKEISLNRDIENRVQQHHKWNEKHIDLTREPLSPVQGQRPAFRPVQIEFHPLTPPSSVNSESFDALSPSQALEKSEPTSFRYNSPPPEDEPQGRPAYRRRIGRCNRLWIDRRGMASASRNFHSVDSDRWRYDQDDDDEQPVYEVDPYDIGALKFRATIPLPPHFLPQRRQEGASALAARANGTNPSNARAIVAAPPSAPS